MESFYLSHEEFWEWFNRDPSRDNQMTPRLNTIIYQRGEPNVGAPTGGSPKSNQSIHRSNSISGNLDNDFDEADDAPEAKRVKFVSTTNKNLLRHTVQTEPSLRYDSRYIIMYGKHRPAKKSKVWEGDGYLTLANGVAHLSDLKGRMLEDPAILDDVDMESIRDLGELMIGNTEVQVLELDK